MDEDGGPADAEQSHIPGAAPEGFDVLLDPVEGRHLVEQAQVAPRGARESRREAFRLRIRRADWAEANMSQCRSSELSICLVMDEAPLGRPREVNRACIGSPNPQLLPTD